MIVEESQSEADVAWPEDSEAASQSGSQWTDGGWRVEATRADYEAGGYMAVDEADQAEMAGWNTKQWMEQCSKHLSNMERRMMDNEVMGHEMVRQMQEIWNTCSPPPKGDWGWIFRKTLEYCVRALRILLKIYRGEVHEGLVDFTAK